MAKPFLGGRIVLGTEFAGYKIGIFEPGTTTPKTTYTDANLTAGNENTHPVTLDANGAAQIYFNGNAKAIFYTAASAVVYTDDNINLDESSSSTGADNLLLNGSFEDDTDGDGIPDNWTRTLYTGGAFTVDTTTQSNGDTSIKFTSTGTGGGYITSTSTFAISPSITYSVGFSLKSSDAGVRNVVEILWYKADGTASSTASTTLLDDSTTNPTSWTENWYETASPSDAYFAKIRLTGCHSSDATSGSTWFDGVVFTAAAIKRAKNTFTNTVTMSGKSLWLDEGANVTSAADCNIWVGDGNTVHITGTTSPSDWGTAPQAGASMWCTNDSALTLTYNATTNVLPGDADIALPANSWFEVYAKSTSTYEVRQILFSDGRSLGLVTGSVTATTSGTSHDYTIPPWAKKVTLTFSGISSNGTNSHLVQLGDSGGIETSGYAGTVAKIPNGSSPATAGHSSTTGFIVQPYSAATEVWSGQLVLSLVNAATFLWSASGTTGRTDADFAYVIGGHKATSAQMTTVRLTTVGGTDAFDAGSFNVLYE